MSVSEVPRTALPKRGGPARRRLRATLRGELDTIAARALEKAPCGALHERGGAGDGRAPLPAPRADQRACRLRPPTASGSSSAATALPPSRRWSPSPRSRPRAPGCGSGAAERRRSRFRAAATGASRGHQRHEHVPALGCGAARQAVHGGRPARPRRGVAQPPSDGPARCADGGVAGVRLARSSSRRTKMPTRVGCSPGRSSWRSELPAAARATRARAGCALAGTLARRQCRGHRTRAGRWSPTRARWCRGASRSCSIACTASAWRQRWRGWRATATPTSRTHGKRTAC